MPVDQTGLQTKELMMSKVYRRFFKVTDGPFVDAMNEIRAQNEENYQQAQSLCEKHGGKSVIYWNRGGIAAFVFDEDPGRDWKLIRRKALAEIEGVKVLPKKSCKKGKEVSKELDAIPKHRDLSEALAAIGLPNNYPLIFMCREGKALSAYYCGSHSEKIYFISVPWKEVSNEELEAYKKDSNSYDSELKFLTEWNPHESMEEVKEWEVDKYMDELKERASHAN